MHDSCRLFVQSVAPLVPLESSVCEIGSRNVNGAVRYLFAGRRYVGIDLREGPGVDIVADGATWNGDDETYDAVICCEVLEHAADPQALCENIRWLLRGGGAAIITAATPQRVPHSGIDGGPLRDGEQYQGVTEDDLREWFGVGVTLSIYPSPVEDIYAVVGVP